MKSWERNDDGSLTLVEFKDVELTEEEKKLKIKIATDAFANEYPGCEIPEFEIDAAGRVTFMADLVSDKPGYNFIMTIDESK